MVATMVFSGLLRTFSEYHILVLGELYLIASPLGAETQCFLLERNIEA
jgi:hypothetical protein